ncbi:MAG: hypothetical protein HY303_02800 [Candidatus Wallbacteria bacterium]|nr:hypothetical protein [Candidatus Wallbacteria bacterium]
MKNTIENPTDSATREREASDPCRFSRRLSIAAGLVNIVGVLVFSNGFTNETLKGLFPQAFSSFGLICIMLWGLAYIAAGVRPPNRYLYAVFALEKALYGMSWIWWMATYEANLATVFQKSITAGLFYASYGLTLLRSFTTDVPCGMLHPADIRRNISRENMAAS